MVWTFKWNFFGPCTLYRACTAVLSHARCMHLWFWQLYPLIYTFLESAQLFWWFETILAKIGDTFWKNIFFSLKGPPFGFWALKNQKNQNCEKFWPKWAKPLFIWLYGTHKLLDSVEKSQTPENFFYYVPQCNWYSLQVASQGP